MDLLQRGINAEKTVRVVAATTTELIRDACTRHNLQGAEAIILGRALTAGCLLVTLTKNDTERVRLNIQADGPAGHILVDARGDGSVRGCLERRLARPQQPRITGHRTSVSHLVGTGAIVVTRDVGLEQEYQGIVEVRSGEIDIDLESYLGISEQLPSALACEVLLDANDQILRSAGVLCQTFPGAAPDELDRLRANLHGGGLGELLRQDRSTVDLMGFALLGGEFEAMHATSLRFRCTCGPQRALQIVSVLGADDIEELAREQGTTEVRCSFCGESYLIDDRQLFDLAGQLRSERS
jgi:molecular chaperone Hsp33